MYDKNTSPLIRDNDMSSLKVPTDCCVTVYADEGYAGESRTFCENEPWLGTYGWNDKVSSIKIEQGMSHRNFNSRLWVYDGPCKEDTSESQIHAS